MDLIIHRASWYNAYELRGENKMANNKLPGIKILLPLALIAVVAVGGAAYVKMAQDKAPQTDQQAIQEQEKEAKPVDPKTSNEAYARSQAAPSSTSQAATNTTSKQSAAPTITSIGQSGDTVYINAIVDNQTNGTCTLTLHKEGAPSVTRSAPLGLVTSYYACQGFNVERSVLATAGEWTAEVRFSNASAEGTSAPRKVTVQ
jgi:cytoskeletal protein RodZ